MQRIGTLITFMCVLFGDFQRVFGKDVKIKVKPGGNVTIFCDKDAEAFQMIWIKNGSYGNQSSLLMTTEKWFQGFYPRFSFVQNRSSHSFDLHIENVSIHDEGIYYCAKGEKILKDVNGTLVSRMEYQYGNRITHLAVSEAIFSETPLAEVSELICISWNLLFGVCSLCILLSSLLSAACVSCFCRAETTGSDLNGEILRTSIFKVDPTEKHQCEISKTEKNGNICLDSEVTYRLLSSAHLYDKKEFLNSF